MEVAMSLLAEEPVELRDRIRVLAAVAPAQARRVLVQEVALLVGAVHSGFATPATGLDVECVCRGYERELWLWLVGERTWVQCASGLEGRLLRRLRAPQP
jgi:hypothetical protein